MIEPGLFRFSFPGVRLEDKRARFEEERRRFAVAQQYTYLNHASRGPISPPAREAMDRIIDDALTVHPDQIPGMARDFDEARQSIADLIGAPKKSIAFVPNTSTGIALAAGTLPIAEGDNVIGAHGEFPSNIFPWLNLTRRGVDVRLLEQRPGGITADQVREAMDERTRVVALSWIGFSDGARIDVPAIADLCASTGAFLVLDAIQGIGAIRAELEGVHFLVCGSGKWTLVPQGGGFVYIDPDLIETLHPDRVGWLSVASNADMTDFSSLTDYRFDLVDDARRVETGSNSLLVQTALGASCAYLHALGPEAIEKRIVRLCDTLIEGLQGKGIEIATPIFEGRRSGIVSFPMPDAPAVAERLIEHGVIVSAREGKIRTGIHFYNNENDIDRLLALL